MGFDVGDVGFESLDDGVGFTVFGTEFAGPDECAGMVAAVGGARASEEAGDGGGVFED